MNHLFFPVNQNLSTSNYNAFCPLLSAFPPHINELSLLDCEDVKGVIHRTKQLIYFLTQEQFHPWVGLNAAPVSAILILFQ